MSDALLRAGRQVEFIRFQDENHYPDKAKTRGCDSADVPDAACLDRE